MNCVNNLIVKNLVILLAMSVSLDVAAANLAVPGNCSEFPGHRSGVRLAYCRWRTWLMSRPAVLDKVPPSPRNPSASVEDLLDVRAELTPVSIFHVDAAHQTVQISGRLMLEWQDPALAVDENLVEEFTDGNVTLMPESVPVPNQVLWQPDIIFVEGVNSLSIYHSDYYTTVLQDGTISLHVTFTLHFGCRFHMNEYPFDEHRCPITLYDVSMNTNLYPWGSTWESGLSDLNEKFGVSGEWDLINVTEETSFRVGQPYPRFVLHLRRKTTFYSVVMLFPMVLTSYLNVLVFLLPPDLGDKASYLVTLTVSMSVYVAFFNTDMPRGLESVPRIFVLLIFVYAESFCILLMCMAVSMKYSNEKGFRDKETPTPFRVLRGSSGNTSSECDNCSSEERGIVVNVSAKRLDTIFFSLAFIVNTVGLAYILTALQSGV